MKTLNATQTQAGFTMVEIALCLGIIAFALVAILGIMPTGARVQRDNREESIIEQDARYIMEAIRGGSEFLPTSDRRSGMPYLLERTNNPANINDMWTANIPPNPVTASEFITFLTNPNATPANPGFKRAHIRSLSGSMATKSSNTNAHDLAFSYQLDANVVPFWQTGWRNVDTTNGFFCSNLYLVRLEFRWPLRPDGTVAAQPGNASPKTYNLLVSGHVLPINNGLYLRP